MIRANFLSSEERAELEGCVRRHSEEHGVARRANAVLLLDKGKSCAAIAEFLYLDDDTIRNWYKSYRQDVWDALALDGWQGGQSCMTPAQEATLCSWQEGRFCRAAGDIRAYIKAEFGLHYSHSGCLKLLRRLGFEYRKPKALPHVADEAKQAEFIAFYENLLNDLPADEAVYFADAVHPEYQTKPAFGWVRKGSNPAVKTTSGRGGSISMALCAWKILTRLSWSLSAWTATARCSFRRKLKLATQPNQLFTSFGTTRPIIGAIPSKNGSHARIAASI